MIRKNAKVLILSSLVILLPVLAGMILWNRLPEQIPTHWNAAGEVDGWGSKAFSVFGIPLIMLALQWVCVLVTMADPKRENHGKKLLQLVFWIIPILNVALCAATYTAALGKEVPMAMLMPVMVGVVLTVIGNYLPKCKQNYTVGIKIPWTLSSTENWNRTHRFAGRVWVVCGLIMILAGFFGIFWILIGAAVPMVLAPVAYSYVLYRRGV